jgi:hypothetical protein
VRDSLWNNKEQGCHVGDARQPTKALITAGGFGDGTLSRQLSLNSSGSKGVPGTFKNGRLNPPVLRLPNHESGSDHRMLPIRWILPIVGALFALALAPLAFSPQDSARNTSVASVERPEPRQTIVPAGMQLKDPAGMQRNDDDLKTSPNLDVGDVTGSIQPATPLRAEPVIKSPSKRIKHVQSRSRKLVHQRAKQARVANFFGAQQARRTAKPDMKFNAVY